MLQIEQTGVKDYGPCECCGAMSRLVAGFIHRDGAPYAGYQVHWTLRQLEKHGASFYLILGQWGEGTVAADRFAVALNYRADAEQSGFMVVDAAGTSVAKNPLVGRALDRDSVVGTALAQEVFDLVDLVWLQDPRIAEITRPDLST